ncbi:PQQ-binding-like beta-propeller repeat protein [Halonotius sp. GCM10025705]|uniref:outer membrane protein assembly factor BamB family protein n=1 Tax=Halonotius sp. GCM10025705 TaxID=3252678 RepID=UPI00360D9106
MTPSSSWPTYQATASRSGYHPTQQPPAEPLSCAWTFDTTSVGDDEWGIQGIGSGSPVVGDGIVYFTNDAGVIFALDTETGSQRWVYTDDENVHTTTSPTLTGETLFVGIDDTLYALDPETGAQKWSVTIDGESIHGSPTVIDDFVVISGGNVYGINQMSGDIAWVTETSGETTTSPAALGETVYIVDDTELQAIDVQDGSEIWTTNVDCEFATTPVVDETTVFVGGEDGSLAAIDANGGETRWTKEICNEIEAAPAVANGVVVVGNAGLWDEHNALHALDAQDGSIKWSFGDTRFSIQSASGCGR